MFQVNSDEPKLVLIVVVNVPWSGEMLTKGEMGEKAIQKLSTIFVTFYKFKIF